MPDTTVQVTPAVEWDGNPLNPEQSGPHWFCGGDGVEFVAHWIADPGGWIALERDDVYLEPVLTPADHAALKARIKTLEAAVQGFLNIVDESHGVAGYHLNGALAEWDEFEEVGTARDVLAEKLTQ